MTSLTCKGYSILKSKINVDEIKKELTIKPKETPYTCIFVDYSFPIFRETETKLIVPRFYGQEKFGKPDKNLLLNGIEKLRKLELGLKPRDYQVKPLLECLSFLRKSGGCILQVQCGWGKSFAGVYLANKLGYKTIIIAPRVKIVTQWISEIKRFLPGARVGLLQGKVREIDNVDFCVATLQTIALHDDIDFKSFGFAIFDELPLFAANKMSTTLWKVYSMYNIGLSADPKRADGLDKIFELYLGPHIVKSEILIKRKHKVVVKWIHLKERIYEKRMERTGNLNFAQMLNDLTESDVRFNVLMTNINELLTNDKRKILVMADRRSYLEKLYNITKKNWPTKECLLYLGGNSKKKLLTIDEELKEEKYDIIFSTYALISIGVSIDYLNTAIFATPKKAGKTEQASGRIERIDHDIEPIIIDLVDNNSIFKNQARTRKAFYKKKDWVQKDGSIEEIEEKKKDKEAVEYANML